jgi:hypothetical protein
MEDMAPERLRPGCFTDKGDAGPCPHCGYAEEAARAPLLLGAEQAVVSPNAISA